MLWLLFLFTLYILAMPSSSGGRRPGARYCTHRNPAAGSLQIPTRTACEESKKCKVKLIAINTFNLGVLHPTCQFHGYKEQILGEWQQHWDRFMSFLCFFCGAYKIGHSFSRLRCHVYVSDLRKRISQSMTRNRRKSREGQCHWWSVWSTTPGWGVAEEAGVG